MLFIDSNSPDVQLAKQDHENFFFCRVKRKLGHARCSQNCKACATTQSRRPSSRSIYFGAMVAFLTNNNIKTILSGTPPELETINNQFLNSILPRGTNDFTLYLNINAKNRPATFPDIHKLVLDINSIFDYNYFNDVDANKPYGAYGLAKKLNRRSCTYCNRTYTTTIARRDNKKITRPTFDHWFPQYKYPLLSISFFNLIPSCGICNSSVKNDIELNLRDHIHPYIDTKQTSEFKFSYFYSKSKNTYRIFIVPTDSRNKKAFKTLRRLLIDEVYNTHHEELEDLIKIKDTYSTKFIERLNKFFPKSKLSVQEAYRMIFGVEYDVDSFHKRPMSKFKKDILEELELI